MNKYVPHEEELDPDTLQPWEVEGGWSQKQRKRAKQELYAMADSLDQAEATEDEVCAFLTMFGQQIGSGSYHNWYTRAEKWANRKQIEKAGVDSTTTQD